MTTAFIFCKKAASLGYWSDSCATRFPAFEKYIADTHLIEHIEFFDTVFPMYEVFPDEITAEGNHIVVKARLKGRHEGELNGIPPTYKNVEFPFAIGYEIANGKIVSHWLIADQMILMEQLGVMNAVS